MFKCIFAALIIISAAIFSLSLTNNFAGVPPQNPPKQLHVKFTNNTATNIRAIACIDGQTYGIFGNTLDYFADVYQDNTKNSEETLLTNDSLPQNVTFKFIPAIINPDLSYNYFYNPEPLNYCSINTIHSITISWNTILNEITLSGGSDFAIDIILAQAKVTGLPSYYRIVPSNRASVTVSFMTTEDTNNGFCVNGTKQEVVIRQPGDTTPFQVFLYPVGLTTVSYIPPNSDSCDDAVEIASFTTKGGMEYVVFGKLVGDIVSEMNVYEYPAIQKTGVMFPQLRNRDAICVDGTMVNLNLFAQISSDPYLAIKTLDLPAGLHAFSIDCSSPTRSIEMIEDYWTTIQELQVADLSDWNTLVIQNTTAGGSSSTSSSSISSISSSASSNPASSNSSSSDNSSSSTISSSQSSSSTSSSVSSSLSSSSSSSTLSSSSSNSVSQSSSSSSISSSIANSTSSSSSTSNQSSSQQSSSAVTSSSTSNANSNPNQVPASSSAASSPSSQSSVSSTTTTQRATLPQTAPNQIIASQVAVASTTPSQSSSSSTISSFTSVLESSQENTNSIQSSSIMSSTTNNTNQNNWFQSNWIPIAAGAVLAVIVAAYWYSRR